mmetsp:Transcript_3652/g.12878  ORF Transcript_3652/g.12878 Transcript_3652/m.12878 type:complete len:160 (+) Transcript_3652:40-519(+)
MAIADIAHRSGMQFVALIVGLLLSMVVITGFEGLSIVLNHEEYARGLPDRMPEFAAGVVLVGYIVGTSVAAFVMCHISGKSMVASLFLAVALTAAQYVHYSHQIILEAEGRKKRALEPLWFHMIAIACFLPAAIIGCRIAKVSARTAQQQVPAAKLKSS